MLDNPSAKCEGEREKSFVLHFPHESHTCQQIPVFDLVAYDELDRFIYHFSFIDTMTTT